MDEHNKASRSQGTSLQTSHQANILNILKKVIGQAPFYNKSRLSVLSRRRRFLRNVLESQAPDPPDLPGQPRRGKMCNVYCSTSCHVVEFFETGVAACSHTYTHIHPPTHTHTHTPKRTNTPTKRKQHPPYTRTHTHTNTNAPARTHMAGSGHTRTRAHTQTLYHALPTYSFAFVYYSIPFHFRSENPCPTAAKTGGGHLPVHVEAQHRDCRMQMKEACKSQTS